MGCHADRASTMKSKKKRLTNNDNVIKVKNKTELVNIESFDGHYEHVSHGQEQSKL